MWMSVGWCQSSANCGEKLWLDSALCISANLAEITVWGGLKEACKGSKQKHALMLVKSHSKLWLISADMKRERMFDFFVTISSAALLHDLMIFSKSAIGQILLVSLRHSQDWKHISDFISLLIFIAYCFYTQKRKLLFLITCKSFLICFSLSLQAKHLSKSRQKI